MPFSFPSSWRWLDRPPLRLDTGLQGHVVVVLFWRLGCAHSRAALSELALAGLRFAGRPVALVAVHVPVDEGEDDDERVRRQLAQLPAPLVAAVAPDADDVERLPTMVLVDAAGEVRARAAGVPRRRRLREALEELCGQAIASGRAAAVPFVPHLVGTRGGLLPVAATHDGERLWLASAGQRRVFAVAADGEVTASYGSGAWGRQDGDASSCSFALPAALCAHDGYIAVADAQTHTLRAIDVAAGEVVTWVGNGQFGADDVGGGYGLDQPLGSPAGIVGHEGGLYLCQPGVGQLWQVDPMTGAAMAWLGGDYGGERFAQPIALAADGERLWLAEAGRGALTCIDLGHVAVHERIDGMRRPSAVAVVGERVFVADAGAGAVFERDGAAGALRPLFGRDDGLHEPVALASDGERLFVGDVAADAVFVADLSEGAPLRRLELRGVPRPARLRGGGVARVARPVHLREHSDVTLRIAAPDREDGETAAIDVVDEADPVLAVSRDTVVEIADGRAEVLLPVTEGLVGALRVRVRIAGATENYVLPVTVGADGALEVDLSAD